MNTTRLLQTQSSSSPKAEVLHEGLGSIFPITMDGRESTIPSIDSIGLLICSRIFLQNQHSSQHSSYHVSMVHLVSQVHDRLHGLRDKIRKSKRGNNNYFTRSTIINNNFYNQNRNYQLINVTRFRTQLLVSAAFFTQFES